MFNYEVFKLNPNKPVDIELLDSILNEPLDDGFIDNSVNASIDEFMKELFESPYVIPFSTLYVFHRLREVVDTLLKSLLT